MNRSFNVYAVFTALLAVLCWWAAGWSVPPDSNRLWNALAAFLVLGFLSEASYFRLSVGRAETQSSVAFIPFLASTMLFDTGWASLVAAGSVFAVESVVKRKAPIRVLFNACQMAVSVAGASWIYQWLGGGFNLESFAMAPVAVAGAVLTYFFVNSAAVSLAVVFAYGESVQKAWIRIAGASLAYDLFSSLLAPLLAFLYVQFQIPGILLLIIPLYFVRHLYQVTLQLEQVNRDLLELMVKAIEARDPYTSGHSLRVSKIAAEIAKELGLTGKLVDQISTAALLHDVGKIYEDFAPLLRKESKLDATEKALMQTHPTRSAELVATISAFRGVIEEAVRHHHENFDGTGYPIGLAGKGIPVGARIIMIADTMDAMTTDRPYRKALSYERVVLELEKFAGRQFDPELVALVTRSSAIRRLVTQRLQEQQPEPDKALAVLTAPNAQHGRSGWVPRWPSRKARESRT
jgi:putative nucleotidyltransferase with HDIG domain